MDLATVKQGIALCLRTEHVRQACDVHSLSHTHKKKTSTHIHPLSSSHSSLSLKLTKTDTYTLSMSMSRLWRSFPSVVKRSFRSLIWSASAGFRLNSAGKSEIQYLGTQKQTKEVIESWGINSNHKGEGRKEKGPDKRGTESDKLKSRDKKRKKTFKIRYDTTRHT